MATKIYLAAQFRIYLLEIKGHYPMKKRKLVSALKIKKICFVGSM
jgi:hypothetical protein